MKFIKYTGQSHVREISEEDLRNAYAMTVAGGIRFDTRDAKMMREGIEVSNALADILVEQDGEWEVLSETSPAAAAEPESTGASGSAGTSKAKDKDKS